MKLHLKSSGGFGGLRIEGAVDTADLPEDLAQRVDEHLTGDKLRAASAARSLPMPDAREYELHVLPEDEDGAVEKHVVDDMCPHGEVLDVIDDLLAHIVERKTEAGD